MAWGTLSAWDCHIVQWAFSQQEGGDIQRQGHKKANSLRGNSLGSAWGIRVIYGRKQKRNSPNKKRNSQMLAKLTVTQATELRFTLTNRLLLQLPLRNTNFIQLNSRRSFLSFNSGGAELRATNRGAKLSM